MTTTTDSVAAFCEATRTNDLDALIATLAPDAELISPLSGRMVFRGHDDLRRLLGAVYGGLHDLIWREVIGDGPTRVAISEGRVAGVAITDALVFELDGSGQIRRLRPHLRPWLATTVFAMLLGPKIARHPGVLRRALRH
ncbi:nuclear transport factor 2 family protein [Mycolicibacterium neworleansense]|uniref:SnoaL-like domain protein n=1 Tax=Mycolicibacterium neworleansense TaxID=146018 RepID=A0A0H5RPU7_9MYCO|nr:nuclear transport factor 2 family protein [Mycolicibacterium neworleansense]MCV7365019.1 nuclear transport factor 2 family protein [Mycolicibacterium neworleansense]CRZ15821.1 SnoaL-like domain protein [Mycolicibacterium neworleansense]